MKLKVTHQAKVKIGKYDIPCFLFDDGTTSLSAGDLQYIIESDKEALEDFVKGDMRERIYKAVGVPCEFFDLNKAVKKVLLASPILKKKK